MNKIKFVSCFNDYYLNTIAIHLLNQITEQWDSKFEFHFYYYDIDISKYSLPKSKNIFYHDLEKCQEYKDFIKNFSQHNGSEGEQYAYNRAIDAVSFFPKVLALSDCAFNNSNSWLFWIDADTFALKNIYLKDFQKVFPENYNKCDMISFYDEEKEDLHYIEGFNLNSQTAIELLGDLRGAYISGEFRSYREWHDGFILDRLKIIYSAHGMKLHKLQENKSIISDLFIHLRGSTNIALRDIKGNRIFSLSENQTTPDILPNRYKQLADGIRFYKPKTILETGTWNGGRAIEMALAGFDNSDNIHYIGYDLFEDATIQTDEEEFNVKPHNTMAAVEHRFTEFKNVMKTKGKTFTWELHKGNVRNTLKKKNIKNIDFAFIGSGNSIKTVKHEYAALNKVPIVFLDHYFTEDDDEKTPPQIYQGSKEVYESVITNQVDPKKENKEGWTTFEETKTVRKHLLPSGDNVVGGGITHLCMFIHDTSLDDCPDSLKRVPIQVHPRDCVPDDSIKNNIKANTKLINRWVVKHRPHQETGIIISAGPYINWDELQETIDKNPYAKIFCVKHSYPMLLEHNIKPWACVILDPRPITGKSTHGIIRKNLFKKVDKSTKFMIASMTDPSVTKYLQEKDCTIWGWHAFTETLRDEKEHGKEIVNKKVQLESELNIPQGATLITGGTCAAMRTLGMMHTMGYRDIHLFGFDCCLDEPTEEMKKEKTGDLLKGEAPKDKYIQVTVEDNTYWTTGELLAMAQDCEKVFSDPGMDGVLTFHGENTMIADLWRLKMEKETRPLFSKYYD